MRNVGAEVAAREVAWAAVRVARRLGSHPFLLLQAPMIQLAAASPSKACQPVDTAMRRLLERRSIVEAAAKGTPAGAR